MAGEKILIVDDEAIIHEILSYHLHKEGFQVFSATTGGGVLNKVRQYQPDLILLDILLPELDGIEVCQELRREIDIPIIFITSKDSPYEVALSLGAGGDDYIRKPFNPIEIIARIKAHLRRYRQQHLNIKDKQKKLVLEFPGLKINLANRSVERKGSLVALTVKEFNLLAFLTQNPNQFLSANHIIESLWESPASIDQRALMVHISNLRKKIEDDPQNPKYIITLKGVGYMFSNA